MERIERDLEQFFEQCSKQQINAEQMEAICQPLVWQLRMARAKRWTLLMLPALLIYVLWLYCDYFAWSASSVGRLLLIQVLPYWNWTPYYNAKCLIERIEKPREQREQPLLGSQETHWENCVLCESLDHIPTTDNVSYSLLESQYLERGLPVIVTDAQVQHSLDDLLAHLQHRAPELLSSEPCDVSTNLLLRQLFNVDAALQKIRSLPTQTPWYLQLRNCQFSAVKASRLYVRRPYYYPLHLEPYYSSWLLMAHNIARPQSDIFVRGLIFVQQLSGHFDLQLRPKQPCDEGDLCPRLSLRLDAGECLVFSTDLWSLSYGLQQSQSHPSSSSSIATVLEVDWQL